MLARWRVDLPVTPVSSAKPETQLDKQLRANIAKLQTVAQHLVPGSIEAVTADNQDHTFSGIMFPVECQNDLPVQFIEIQSISVRGDLGPVSVYTCDYDATTKQRLSQIHRSLWQRRFGPEDLPSSMSSYTELRFQVPLRLAPGQLAGIYVHSELEGDMAIVYDNCYDTSDPAYRDEILCIHPGISHTSNVPFSNVNTMWGGLAWRPSRTFVGKIKYGIQFLMWTPLVHARYPTIFQNAIFTFLCSHHVLGKKRMKKPTLGDMPLDVVYKIVNMIPHHWFEDERRSKIKRSHRTREARHQPWVYEELTDEDAEFSHDTEDEDQDIDMDEDEDDEDDDYE